MGNITLDEQLKQVERATNGAIDLIRRYDEAAEKVLRICTSQWDELGTMQALDELRKVYRRELTNVNTSKE